jgi:hypothetical protein
MGISRDALPAMTQQQWDRVMGCGLDFSSHACTLIENYVDKEWAAAYKR